MNSHGASAPVRTSVDSPSTTCVCGEMGYAPMTSGRHIATACATAREPSIWLGMRVDLLVGGAGRGDVAARDGVREPFLDRRLERGKRHDAGHRGQRGE